VGEDGAHDLMPLRKFRPRHLRGVDHGLERPLSAAV
jgi:hypothetical protein